VTFATVIGFLPAGLYTADYQFLADGARRVTLGQAPHIDFSSPVGPLIFWLMAAARHLPQLGPDAFATNTLMWVIVAPMAAVVALRLPSLAQALAFLAIAALVVLSPFNLEPMNDACEVNYNGLYNRYGAALLFITFVAGLTPPGRPARDGALWAGLLAAMLLTKITYGLAGAAFLGLIFQTVDPAMAGPQPPRDIKRNSSIPQRVDDLVVAIPIDPARHLADDHLLVIFIVYAEHSATKS
jgi:hypothetical protein